MTERYQIAIIGAGPAGLSAGCRAAQLGASHILIERSEHLADTIFKYQRGKHVMATPDQLPLKSPLPFQAGSRETILKGWEEQTAALNVNLRLNTEVIKLDGEKGDFRITLAGGTTIEAEAIVMAIGLQGNIRRLQIPGADHPILQYELADPQAYSDETIVVIGAGDSAIENALALAEQNDVILLNRRQEFARAKPDNLKKITSAIALGDLECCYQTSPARIDADAILLKTPDGALRQSCDRVVARIGALPPRRFLTECGISLPSDDPSAVPEVSESYESNRPGLYIIGSLAGYPLIKQGLNQGQEVIDRILNREVIPADQPLLEARLAAVNRQDVQAILRQLHETIPVLAGLTRLQLREVLLESTLLAPPADSLIFEKDEYSDEFYAILEGSVAVHLQPPKRLTAGQYFGEIGLLSERRRTSSVSAGADCLLLRIPRRTMLRLRNSIQQVKRVLDETTMTRYLRSLIKADRPDVEEAIAALSHRSVLKNYEPGAVIFREGDAGESFHIICRGSVTVSSDQDGQEVILSYLKVGAYIGEIALIDNVPRTATVRAATPTETIALDRAAFAEMMQQFPQLHASVQDTMQSRMLKDAANASRKSSNVVRFLVEEGIAIGTDVLLIDETLCIGCDNCEKACAATHGGVSRLDRKAGPTYAMVHVPTSCRHCEHPYCMKDCPPDAIHRDSNGEVFIDDTCIGCGNCEQNCPFGVIQMAAKEPTPTPGILEWLLPEIFSWFKKPAPEKECSQKVAVKCDMCRDLQAGPACVHSCPTGAAIRASPQDFISLRLGSELEKTI